MIYLLNMVNYHSYVKFPEGTVIQSQTSYSTNQPNFINYLYPDFVVWNHHEWRFSHHYTIALTTCFARVSSSRCSSSSWPPIWSRKRPATSTPVGGALALAEETKSETAGDGSSEPRKSEEWQPTYCDILMTASVEIHRELMMELYIYAGIDLWYLWCQSWRSACWNLLSWTSKQTFGPLRAIARPGARQQLDYWGGCTMQAMGWISAGLTRWYRPMVFRYFHHCIHFW